VGFADESLEQRRIRERSRIEREAVVYVHRIVLIAA
jgi:hypothetical protein